MRHRIIRQGKKIILGALGLTMMLATAGCSAKVPTRTVTEANEQAYKAFDVNIKDDAEIVSHDIQVIAAAPEQVETVVVTEPQTDTVAETEPATDATPLTPLTEPQTDAVVETEPVTEAIPETEPEVVVEEQAVVNVEPVYDALYMQGAALSGQNSALINEVYNLTNSVRANAGMWALSLDSELTSIACARAYEIASNNCFSHTRPDGRSCFTILDDYYVMYMAAGENLAYGQDTPQEVVDAWVASSGHYNTMIGDYSKIGIGVCVAGDGTIYWVQCFTN